MLVDSEQTHSLQREAATEKLLGRFMGWTGGTEYNLRMYRRIAEALTAEGEARLRVSEFILRTRVEGEKAEMPAIKVYNEQGTDLSNYWRIVEDVRDQLPWNGYTEEELEEAIKKTIADKKSGELAKRINTRKTEWDIDYHG